MVSRPVTDAQPASRQIAERLGVEEAHMLEFQQFNVVWDNKMKEFEDVSFFPPFLHLEE